VPVNEEDSRGNEVMGKDLQVIKSSAFEGAQIDFYRDDKEEFCATREQIGNMLGYADPDNAIQHIHNRNKERLDKFSTGVKLSQVEGTRTVTREIIAYSFKGLLEICRFSDQPKADAVMDFLWSVADEIRKTGEYHTKPASAVNEVALKRAEAMLNNSRVRIAKCIRETLNDFIDVLSPQSKQAIAAYISDTVTGQPGLIPLPVVEKTYTATEIGEELGMSANKIGRIANEYGLKTNQYGITVLDKAKGHDKQVSTFRYNELGKNALKAIILDAPETVN
jgi:prophage antirepressor-like protein